MWYRHRHRYRHRRRCRRRARGEQARKRRDGEGRGLGGTARLGRQQWLRARQRAGGRAGGGAGGGRAPAAARRRRPTIRRELRGRGCAGRERERMCASAPQVAAVSSSATVTARGAQAPSQYSRQPVAGGAAADEVA